MFCVVPALLHLVKSYYVCVCARASKPERYILFWFLRFGYSDECKGCQLIGRKFDYLSIN